MIRLVVLKLDAIVKREKIENQIAFDIKYYLNFLIWFKIS